jgi:hypothetical protein
MAAGLFRARTCPEQVQQIFDNGIGQNRESLPLPSARGIGLVFLTSCQRDVPALVLSAGIARIMDRHVPDL